MAKKRRIKARFFVLLFALVAAVAAVVVLLISPGGATELEQGSLGFQKDIQVALIRDEQIINAENYSKLNFLINEGERVDKGQKVVEVYVWGFNESVLQELLALQQRIKEYQEDTLRDVTGNQELNSLNGAVSTAAQQARDAVRGAGAADLLAVERTLKDSMEQRRQFLKDTVNTDQTLNEWYSEEASKISQLESFKRDYLAEDSGMVSFYFDGFEALFSPDELPNLTPDSLTRLFRGTLQKPVAPRAETPLYRLVDTLQWYCAFTTSKNDAMSISQGMTVSIAFEGYNDKPYQGTVASVTVNESGSAVYILEMNDDLGPFLAVRQAKATLKQDFTGIKAPVNALAAQDGALYVRIQEAGGAVSIPVRVLYRDDKEAIIESADPSRPLSAGMKLAR